MKDIVILGSTGSIGTQALDVIERNEADFNVKVLTCGRNIKLLKEQIERFRPELAVTASEQDALDLDKHFRAKGIKMEFSYGEEGLVNAAEYDADLIFNSLMGMRGMVPTYRAIIKGRDIALANKETLVAGGSVIMKAVDKMGVKMLPVDSEHSAIFQSLMGNQGKKIERILLTASGGPFRGYTVEQLEDVTLEQALNHPNWSMGKKITIDSATMMNKGLEVIEARWLFNVPVDRIQVLVHPQSILHSAVEFEDTAIIGELGAADMRVPISLALGYPERIPSGSKSLDFFTMASELTFEKPDRDTFRCMDLAYRASEIGGTCPAAMNGANEVLVDRFLKRDIGFMDIPRGIEKIMEDHSNIANPSIDDIVQVDREVRRLASALEF